MIIQAIKGIPADHPISDNYGPLFTKMELPDRQKQLFCRYWFRCECPACQLNYPLLSQFPVEIDACLSTPEETKALKILSTLEKLYFDEGMKAMETGKPHAAIELYKRYIEEYEALTELTQGRFKKSPFKTMLLAQEGIKLCLCSLGSVFITGEVDHK